MQARELRIGNLVDFNGKIETVYAIRNSGVDFYRGKTKKSVIMQSYVWEAIKPIKLTEEWLLRFGFRHIKDNWYNVHANGNTFNVYLFEDLRYRIEIVSQSIGVFEYVHTLQNLYFALSGKELTLKN